MKKLFALLLTLTLALSLTVPAFATGNEGDDWRDSPFQQGHDKGFAEGHDKGYAAGKADALALTPQLVEPGDIPLSDEPTYDEGYQSGLAIGYYVGYDNGYTETAGRAPALVVRKMPVEDVEFVLRHAFENAADRLFAEEVPRFVQHHAAPLERRRVLYLAIWIRNVLPLRVFRLQLPERLPRVKLPRRVRRFDRDSVRRDGKRIPLRRYRLVEHRLYRRVAARSTGEATLGRLWQKRHRRRGKRQRERRRRAGRRT